MRRPHEREEPPDGAGGGVDQDRGRVEQAEDLLVLGLLRAEGRWFLGHPNGDTAWTRNLDASPDAELVLRWPSPVAVHAERLADGPIRESAVMATGQHVFPGNLIYRLARPHVRAAGAYFEIKLR